MLEFLDGAAHYATGQGTLKYDVFNDVAIDTGYLGGSAIASGVTAYTRPRVVKAVGTSSTKIMGARWWTPAATFPLGGGFSAFLLFALHRTGGSGAWSEGTKQISINVLNDGSLEARRGGWAGSVLGATATPVLLNNVWQFIELLAVISATVGQILIRVDNVVVLTLTGINTQALGVAAVDSVEWIPWRFTDLYVCDTSTAKHNYFLGKGFHVLTQPMVANAAVQWIPPSGTNVSQIDAATPDGVMNKTQFVGTVDLFQPSPVSTTVGKIVAVQANQIAQKASVSVAASLTSIVEIDGIRYEGGADALAVNAADARTIFPVAPDDGTDWTVAKVNAASWGYRRAS